MDMAIITGASAGIGKAAAQLFLDGDFRVFNLSRRQCDIAAVQRYSLRSVQRSFPAAGAGRAGAGVTRRRVYRAGPQCPARYAATGRTAAPALTCWKCCKPIWWPPTASIRSSCRP